MVVQVVGANRPVVVGLIHGNPIDGKGRSIVGVEVGIQAAVVLLVDNVGGIDGGEVGDIGDSGPVRRPRPGEVGLVQDRSWVPSGPVNGEPIFSPWPGTVAQFTPSVKPASPHVCAMMLLASTPAPGKVRNCDAMLPEGANPPNADVSYQPVEVTLSCCAESRRRRTRTGGPSRAGRRCCRPSG